MPHFNVEGYSKLPISVPPLEEQKEIVRVLQDLLAVGQSAKNDAEVVLSQIATIRNFILASAFHGELGTNNPNEESAMELLKGVVLS